MIFTEEQKYFFIDHDKFFKLLDQRLLWPIYLLNIYLILKKQNSNCKTCFFLHFECTRYLIYPQWPFTLPSDSLRYWFCQMHILFFYFNFLLHLFFQMIFFSILFITLQILVKSILRQKSFKNPYRSYYRGELKKSGRSHSAPESFLGLFRRFVPTHPEEQSV